MKLKLGQRPSTVTVVDEQPTLYFPPPGQASADLHFPADATGRHRSWRWLVWFLLFVFAVTATAVAATAVYLYNTPYLLPGTQVMGIDVGGQTIQDSAVSLGVAWELGGLSLEDGDEAWTAVPADLGLQLEALATAEKAHARGRSLPGLIEWIQHGRLPVAPVHTLDTAVAATFLEAAAPEIERQPLNAAITVVDGRAQAAPAQPGRLLDVEATVAYLITNQEAVLSHGRLPLSTITIQPTLTDVSSVVNELNQLLSTTIILRAYDPVVDETTTWNLTPDVWGNWVMVDADNSSPNNLVWHLNSETARAFLNTKSVEIGGSRTLNSEEALTAVTTAVKTGTAAAGQAVNLRIYHSPRQYTVQPGDSFAVISRKVGVPYPWIQQANPGVTELSIGQNITIPSPDDLLPFPVVPHKRIVVNISQQTTQVFEHGELKWNWPTSTGIASSPTAPGIFQVQTHVDNAYAANWNLWMPNFMGIYRPVPTSDFMNGFHGFPTRDGANLLWTNNLGSPVTYGCILLSNENAQLLYDWAEEGVVVEIQP